MSLVAKDGECCGRGWRVLDHVAEIPPSLGLNGRRLTSRCLAFSSSTRTLTAAVVTRRDPTLAGQGFLGVLGGKKKN